MTFWPPTGFDFGGRRTEGHDRHRRPHRVVRFVTHDHRLQFLNKNIRRYDVTFY